MQRQAAAFCGAVARGLKRSGDKWLWSSPTRSRQTAWKWVVAPHRLKSLVLKNTTPAKPSSEQEVADYRDALGLIHETARAVPFSGASGLGVSMGMLCCFMPQSGGHWKATNNDIVERHPDGSSRTSLVSRLTPYPYCGGGPDRSATALLLDQHLADPCAGALVILDFLQYPPFPDGNGRMARLLTCSRVLSLRLP